MNRDTLRALQAPLKEQYREDPAAARVQLRASGALDPERLACRVETPAGPVEAGLHAAAGGDGTGACSGEMLLEALVACGGVTVSAVATALGLTLRGGIVRAEGDLDFRGTLGVSKDVAVGFHAIRLTFELDVDANEEQRESLARLTERYCVVAQSLKPPPVVNVLLRT
ncbi:MAG: OsmC family protein [Isosphaeraceae bacterium]|nr:OsmC family protein [Isosphaeraceae bacterium]